MVYLPFPTLPIKYQSYTEVDSLNNILQILEITDAVPNKKT